MKRQKPKSLDNNTYTRLAGKDSDDEDTELLTIPKTTYKEIRTIDKELEEGDTLQKLAIRYHTTISELKRLNKIHHENEIYAKRHIKVPHRPFTLFPAGVHVSGSTSPTLAHALNGGDEPNLNGIASVAINKATVDPIQLENSLLALPSRIDPHQKVNTVIFNSSITSNKPTSSDSDSSSLSPRTEDAHLLLQDGGGVASAAILPKPKVRVVKPSWLWDGADADISWIALISCVVILILAVPLIYVLYIAEHPELYQHPGHHEAGNRSGIHPAHR